MPKLGWILEDMMAQSLLKTSMIRMLSVMERRVGVLDKTRGVNGVDRIRNLLVRKRC